MAATPGAWLCRRFAILGLVAPVVNLSREPRNLLAVNSRMHVDALAGNRGFCKPNVRS
jgi:hypothetical protein